MIILIIAITTPLMVFFSYRQGLKDGKRIEKGEGILPILAVKKARRKLSDDERKSQMLWENINSYDGTNRNQKEVK